MSQVRMECGEHRIECPWCESLLEIFIAEKNHMLSLFMCCECGNLFSTFCRILVPRTPVSIGTFQIIPGRTFVVNEE